MVCSAPGLTVAPDPVPAIAAQSAVSGVLSLEWLSWLALVGVQPTVPPWIMTSLIGTGIDLVRFGSVVSRLRGFDDYPLYIFVQCIQPGLWSVALFMLTLGSHHIDFRPAFELSLSVSRMRSGCDGRH